MSKDEEDNRSEQERFLTIIAYRPMKKIWDETIMVDVRELERMRLAGEPLPTMDDLPEWRRAQSVARRAQPTHNP